MKKTDSRSLSTESQEALRLRAVEAVRTGKSKTEAAALFGVARGTVQRWMKQYRAGGKRALRKKRQGRPPGARRLSAQQESEIRRAVIGRTPDQLQLPFMLWTRAAVGQLLEDKYGVAVSQTTVGRWLKRWGFTPQKPVRRAFERDPAAVRRWLKEEYPSIRRRAKREGAEIHWGDEMGLRSDHQTGRSYGLKGRTPVIAGTGQRFGCNMISTVTNRGTLRFMVFRGRFNAGRFVKFLDRLLRGSRGRIYLIVDGHPAHKSGKVKKWAAAREARLRLFILPGYSPDLNPDEFLNNDVKSNAVGRRRAANQEELVADVHGYLRSTQRQPEIVKRYFLAPSVRYARD